MRRFFIDEHLPLTLGEANKATITGDDARHITRALRLTIGDEITVSFTGWDERAARAVIIGINFGNVTLELKEIFEVRTEPPIKIWLAQSLPKSDKMDFIVQKAVELGVTGIIPLVTRHCVAKYDAVKETTRLERWQKISREAAKQCGRSCIPPVMSVTTLTDFLENQLKLLLKEDANIEILMFYEGMAASSLKTVLTGHCSKVPSYLLIIGPEGGFSPEEVNLSQSLGIKIVGLGPRILRTETAALAAISALMYQHGDLGG